MITNVCEKQKGKKLAHYNYILILLLLSVSKLPYFILHQGSFMKTKIVLIEEIF